MGISLRDVMITCHFVFVQKLHSGRISIDWLGLR